MDGQFKRYNNGIDIKRVREDAYEDSVYCKKNGFIAMDSPMHRQYLNCADGQPKAQFLNIHFQGDEIGRTVFLEQINGLEKARYEWTTKTGAFQKQSEPIHTNEPTYRFSDSGDLSARSEHHKALTEVRQDKYFTDHSTDKKKKGFLGLW